MSPTPNETGWETDCGCPGYGLPQGVAKALAGCPRDVRWLIDEVDELRECVALAYLQLTESGTDREGVLEKLRAAIDGRTVRVQMAPGRWTMIKGTVR